METSKKGGNTVVVSCNCSHGYQDEKYGHGKRVHNRVVNKSGAPFGRCTVCKTERAVGA